MHLATTARGSAAGAARQRSALRWRLKLFRRSGQPSCTIPCCGGCMLGASWIREERARTARTSPLAPVRRATQPTVNHAGACLLVVGNHGRTMDPAAQVPCGQNALAAMCALWQPRSSLMHRHFHCSEVLGVDPCDMTGPFHSAAQSGKLWKQTCALPCGDWWLTQAPGNPSQSQEHFLSCERRGLRGAFWPLHRIAQAPAKHVTDSSFVERKTARAESHRGEHVGVGGPLA